MIEFEGTSVWGFENAIKGMRLPMKSTGKSDSGWAFMDCDDINPSIEFMAEKYDDNAFSADEYLLDGYTYYQVGEKDMKLAMTLAKAGADHGKFLRGIHVQTFIESNTFWIAEHDTYKISTVRNSESFMHKGIEEGFTIDKFDTGLDEYIHDGELDYPTIPEELRSTASAYINVLCALNDLRYLYNKTKDDKYFFLIRRLLPSGWKIKYFWDANYAVLRNIYHQRKNHRLPEWHEFCAWIESLPYSELITEK